MLRILFCFSCFVSCVEAFESVYCSANYAISALEHHEFFLPMQNVNSDLQEESIQACFESVKLIATTLDAMKNNAHNVADFEFFLACYFRKTDFNQLLVNIDNFKKIFAARSLQDIDYSVCQKAFGYPIMKAFNYINSSEFTRVTRFTNTEETTKAEQGMKMLLKQINSLEKDKCAAL